MKKTFTFLLLGAICFSACRKEKNYFTERVPDMITCIVQTANPIGKSYSGHSLKPIIYTERNCGLIPLSIKSYWVYQDSIYVEGSFNRVQFDTLHFTSTWKTVNDGLIWWESNINIGIPSLLYANDSAIFGLENRLFTSPVLKDVRQHLSLFSGDSLLYLANFNDIAAQGRSIKINSKYKTPAGIFNDCVYFEKNARGYRKEQLVIKPGVGVLKYIYEEAPRNERTLKMQKVMTLVSFHLE